MQLALCGVPGGGKSTIFSALSGRRVAGEHGRAEASQAILPVPDERLDKLAAMYNPKKLTFAQVVFVDPPVPATKAEDPTARLPQELRQADGLVEVVRNFDGGMGAPDPAGDHQAFADELILNDLITVERRMERIAGERRRGRKVDQEEIDLLDKAKEMLEAETPLRTDPELARHPKMKGFGLLSAKPLIVVANNEEDDPDAPDLGGDGPPVVVRAAIEAELAELDREEREAFMSDLGLNDSALNRLISAGYQALDLISFFTVGEDEVRAWTIRRGTPAVEAAGVIHSDLQKGFIRAEVTAYQDLLDQGSENAVKKAGLMKLVGKDYIVSDAEIMHVRFNV